MVRQHIKKAANALTSYSKKTANLIGSKLYYALAILAWPVMKHTIDHNIVPEDRYNENNPSDPYANLKALEKEVRKNPDLLKDPKGPATVSLSLKFRNSLGHIDFRKFTNKWKDYLMTWARMARLVKGNEEAIEIEQVEKEIDAIVAADESQKVEPEVSVPQVAEEDVEEPEDAEPEAVDESEVSESDAEEPEVEEPEVIRSRHRNRSRSRRSKSRRARPDGYSG